MSEHLEDFLTNIRSIRLFEKYLGALADENDKRLILNFAELLGDAFGFRVVNITPVDYDSSAFRVAMETKETLEDKSGYEGARFVIDGEPQEGNAALNKVAEFAMFLKEEPEAAKKAVAAFQLYRKKAATQGWYLRRGAVVTLVSYFEAVLEDLIQEYYVRYPNALPAESSSISLEDVRKLGGVEEVESHIAAQEAKSVIAHKNTRDQFTYFKRRLGVDLSTLDSLHNSLTELIERRNILVHNNGKIDKTYLSRISASQRESIGAKEGESLGVSSTYLVSAIDYVETSGLIFIQQCWRQWARDEDNADAELVSRIFEALNEEEFSVVLLLANYASQVGISGEQKLYITINRAIALRELERSSEISQILDPIEWSTTALRFQAARSLLLDQMSSALRLLKLAIEDGQITKSNLDEWILFKPIRNNPEFTALSNSIEDN